MAWHDLSKFRPDEWRNYAEYFYGYQGGSWSKATDRTTGHEEVGYRERYTAFMLAFLKHLHRNPHHEQHWRLSGQGDKPEQLFEMPESFVREMLADWDGAGKAINGKQDTVEWYKRTQPRLHPNTKVLVERLLGIDGA